ncbi:Ig-like domain-containing protein [Pseudomonas syringae pv. actinidiae]|nr:Ig-like domain-containing protein [Pseudomonas syringae pv. actinidiae]
MISLSADHFVTNSQRCVLSDVRNNNAVSSPGLMMNTILEQFRNNGSSSLLKKIFVGYLSLVAGCASTTDTVVRSSSAVSQVAASQGEHLRLQNNHESISDQSNPFGLPDLGKSPVDTAKIQKKKDVVDPMLGAPSIGLESASGEKRLYKSQDAKDMQALLAGMANTASTTAVKDWFSAHHATAQMNVGMGESGVRTGSFDLLMPIFDNKNDDLLFTQLGIRRSNQFSEDYRTTLNLGMGYRHQVDKWLLGVNSFYDRDMTGKNERLGLGMEAWTDNLKLSANSYLRLSDWKKSPDIEDYLERPANGWDMRAEAFLPSYPQLSGKVMYEQYYGDQVSLFGGSSRQKDPSASTVGLSYTPIPLVSISADYRRGQNGLSETSMLVGLNYRIGDSWKQQLSPDQVRATKLLESARYDLVSRRNDIVLDHKKIEHGSIVLPDHVDGTASTTLNFPINLLGPSVSNFSWRGTAAAYALPYGGGPSATIQLPVNSSTSIQSYSLQAIGMDGTGKLIESNLMMINVDPVHIALKSSKTTGLSDGVDNIDFTAQLSKSSGEALPNIDVVWAVEGQATVTESDVKTNASGMARMRLFSRFANNVKVSVGQVNGAKIETAVTFVPNEPDDKVDSVAGSAPSVVSDGLTSTVLTAIVHDSKGLPVKAGVKISWKTDLGTLSASTSLTDEGGKATVSLSSTANGIATVTASGVKGASSTTVSFIPQEADDSVISVSSPSPSVVSDGLTSTVLTAIVHDSKGLPAKSGVKVSWKTDFGSLSSSTSLTDASGKAAMSLSSAETGVATVTASGVKGSSSTTISFTQREADDGVASVSSAVAGIISDGASSAVLTAIVQDSKGLPVKSGVKVSWKTDLGTLSSASSVTDANGNASVSLTSTKSGVATVTASGVKGSSSTTISITEANQAKVSTVSATPNELVADGVANAQIQATVLDAKGVSVGAGVAVSWTTTIGALIDASSLTNASGVATTHISSLQGGEASVTASASHGAATTKINFTDAPSEKVSSLEASLEIIPADGITKSTLTATIVDKNGKAAPQGTPVKWSTTLGTLSSASAVTDTNGKSVVTIESGTEGSATITATAIKGAATVGVTFTKKEAAVASLTTDHATIVGDGIAVATLSAILHDDQGKTVGAGYDVAWTTTAGHLSSASSQTDSNGKATVSLSGTDEAIATVTAGATKGSSSVSIEISADMAKATLSLSAEPATTTAYSHIELLAKVTSASGKAVPNVQVTWTTDYVKLRDYDGMLESSIVTDADGSALNDLHALNPGSYSVTATFGTHSVTTPITVLPDYSSTRISALTSSKSTVSADGVETVILTATMTDGDGHLIGAGQPVSWTTSIGSLSSSSTMTNASSQATVSFTSKDVGTAKVTAAGADSRTSAKKSVSVTVTTDYSVARITRVGDSSDRTPVADGSDRPFIYFHVSDSSGNDVVGIPITVTHTGVGEMKTYDQKTDNYGDAYVTITSTAAGSYSLVGSIQNDTRTINGSFSSTAVVSSLSSDKTSVGTDSFATLTAKVEDSSGKPIQGTWLNWSTSLGSLYDQSMTDQNGYATAKVRSTSVGSAVVTASSSGGSSRSATVNFTAPAPVPRVQYISMNANQGSADEGILPYVMVVDQNGNPMDNVTVEFTCEGSFCTTSNEDYIVEGNNGVMRAITGSSGSGLAGFSTRAPHMEGTAIFRARIVDANVNDAGFTQAYEYYILK